MEISSFNNIQNVKNNYKKKTTPPAFQASSDVKNSGEISHANADFNVKVPIAYKHIQDIKLNDEITASVYKLANGQRVVIIPKKGTTLIDTYVNTGSFNEPDNVRGISHYIEHNLFNGSEDLGDEVFFDEVTKLGANTNASTSFACTNYYIQSTLLDKSDFEKQMRLHAGMVQSPKFLADKLEKEKKIVNSEINMYQSEDGNVAMTRTIKNLFNIKSSSDDLVAGTTNNIDALTRDDVVKYFNENYYPANMVTVISGDFEKEEAIKLVSKYFNSTKMPQGERTFEKMTPIENSIRQDIISEKSDSNAATIILGFAGCENSNYKDKMYLNALEILTSGLYNSRFAQTQRQFGTDLYMFFNKLSSRPQDREMISIETKISEENVEPLLKNIYSLVDKLTKEPPTQEELNAIKLTLKKRKQETLETSYGINRALGENMLNESLQGLTEYDEIVDNMTAQDILNVAKKYLDLNKAALTVVHPKSATSNSIQQNYLNTKQTQIAFTGKNDKTPIDLNKITSYRTANNYEVIFNNATTDNIYYNYCLYKSNWTPKNPAAIDVLNNMLNHAGTTKSSIDELNKQADNLGIDYNMSACDYSINISADFPSSTTKETLKFFDELLKNPNFTQDEFEKAVERLKTQYLMQEINPYSKLNKAIYKGTSADVNIDDLLKGLETLTLEDVKNAYKEIIENGTGCISATGAFDKDPELKQEIFNTLNKLPSVQPWSYEYEKNYRPIEKTEVFTEANNKNQANIVQAFTYKHSGNIKDVVSIDIMNTIFGDGPNSRLFNDLRESRHLAYSVRSNNHNLGDLGVFELNIGTTTENMETGEETLDNIKKSIDGFNENIQKITTEFVTEEELTSAKKALKSALLSSLERNKDKNNTIMDGKYSYYNVSLINKYFETIDSITAEDIFNTARYIFKNPPVYSLTATQKSIDANKEFLDNLCK